ncbi:hypothetical protein LCGC14_1217460 [marine sediment metagenome]|uniref:Beta-lactamase-related domain-containing protein n=1 Tax=marine sediment metagenome TaxID=412755 RepID=A0A0F9LGA9_9ZZZZ|nr:penicillin-binding protein [Candidatus Aminicenantes bacterium]
MKYFMKGRVLLYALFFLVLVASAALIQEKKKEKPRSTVEAKIDKIFAGFAKPESPGAAVAVLKEGMVVFRKGYGSAQLEYKIPITPSTIFHVASVSKQFTAMAITMLEAQGKLSVDDDIHKYLPDIPDFGKKITIRHLLHHVSGLRDQWELLIMSGWRMDDVITQDHILDVVKRQKELNFMPGDRYMYCNTGYSLMAEIVSKISGKPFVEWVKENIFDPLGMSSTHFHIDHEQIVKNRAYSYAKDEEKGFKKSVLNYANVGATSLFTTVEDMTNWMRNFDEKRIGGKEVIDRMLTQAVLNNGKKISYARGVVIGTYKGLKTIGHSGGDAGFRSNMLYFPGEKFGVVVLSNLASSQPTRLCQQVTDIYLAKKLKEAKKEEKKPASKKIKLKEKQLLACEGTYWLETSKLLRRIVLEKKKLYYVRSKTNRTELAPISVTEFIMLDIPIEVIVRFSQQENGKYARVTVLIPGEDPIPGKRIEPFEPTEADLKEYAGTYHSEELDVKYRFMVRDGKLYIRFRNFSKDPFNPLIRDVFSLSEGYIRLNFQRNEQGQISGFLVNTGRVVDLKFKKLAAGS